MTKILENIKYEKTENTIEFKKHHDLGYFIAKMNENNIDCDNIITIAEQLRQHGIVDNSDSKTFFAEIF